MRNSTLIYQLNSKTSEQATIFCLQSLLEEEYLLKDKLFFFKDIRIKSPRIKILSK